MERAKGDFINKLMKDNRYGAVYILARYFYRVGEPVFSDAVYEKLERILSERCPDEMQEFLSRSYDDDPIPEELLNEIGVKPIYFVKKEGRKELYNYLNEDKSFSIRSVTSYEEAFGFFKVLKKERLDFVVSLKVDGVNTKMLYLDSEFSLSLSRGRNGDSFDYTDNSAKIMPQRIEGCSSILKIVGESYVVGEGLPVLREKYRKPDGYVSGKSSAISMLRVEHEREDYKFLKTRVFYAEGLGNSLAETLERLCSAGVDVVPIN